MVFGNGVKNIHAAAYNGLHIKLCTHGFFSFCLIQRSKEKQKPLTKNSLNSMKGHRRQNSYVHNTMGSKKFRNRIANFDTLQIFRS